MSRYRWLRPSKCIETMEYFPSLAGAPIERLQRLLFDAVARGDVESKLNDVEVPREHIAVYLSLYARAKPEQEPYTLPPDLALNYDHLCAVFDRPSVDNRKRGRPAQEGFREDQRLAFEMHKMIAGPPATRRANSAAEAARILVEEGKVPGAGTPQSRAKRLERVFRKLYSS